MMTAKSDRLTHTRETALRLIKCMGVSAALEYCKDSQWMGIANEIRTIREERQVR